jgi:branched-chain amino acid transport system ATP-binding protein
VTAPILEVEALSKRFGNFVALNRVSARFETGRLSAIIGPNGAGKSTFFNVVSGAFAPSSGRLKFQGRDITGLAQHEFARCGIAKSFQITNVFRQLSAHENVRVAVQMKHSRYQLFKPNWQSAPARCSNASAWRRRPHARQPTWRTASSAHWKWRWRWPASRRSC